MRGHITKLVGGTYSVRVKEETFLCRARGNFRHKNISPVVGDFVEFEEGYILDVYDRVNELVRPQIANVDQVLLVFSAKEPDISTLLLDRLLTLIEIKGIKIILVITKMDLLKESEKSELFELMSYYERYYEVHYTKSLQDHNFTSFHLFEDKVTVLAGQSGVGKSSLINALTGRTIETAAISKKLGRGKHTTRHTELLDVHGGLVADTPGFSALDFSQIAKEEVRDAFVDFVGLADHCKFRGCFHEAEPKCNVKQHLDQIPASRYENYLTILKDVEDNKSWR